MSDLRGPLEAVKLKKLKERAKGDGKVLLGNWTVTSKQRLSGSTQGHWDYYFYSPAGRKFRSTVEVFKHLRDIGATTGAKALARSSHKSKRQKIGVPASDPEMDLRAQGFPILELPTDILHRILSHLTSWELLNVSAASKQLACTSEAIFKSCASDHPDWMRRSKIRSRTATKNFSWRSLFWQNVCRTCGRSGDISVRLTSSGNCALRISPHSFWICRRCYHRPDVSRQLSMKNCSVQSC